MIFKMPPRRPGTARYFYLWQTNPNTCSPPDRLFSSLSLQALICFSHFCLSVSSNLSFILGRWWRLGFSPTLHRTLNSVFVLGSPTGRLYTVWGNNREIRVRNKRHVVRFTHRPHGRVTDDCCWSLNEKDIECTRILSAVLNRSLEECRRQQWGRIGRTLGAGPLVWKPHMCIFVYD